MNLTHKELNELGWPQNLLHELFGDNVPELPKDIEPTLEYVLWMLSQNSERSVDMLLSRFRAGKTWEQIGKDYGVTRERVRQIVMLAIRRLRHPSRLKRIQYGISGMADIKCQEGHAKGYQLGYQDGINYALAEQAQNCEVTPVFQDYRYRQKYKEYKAKRMAEEKSQGQTSLFDE